MNLYDVVMMDALRAISEISLRPWPAGEEPVTFHESYVDDAKRVRALSQCRPVFGRSSKYLVLHWDAVNYLSSHHFLYLLPAILLAVLENPRSQLARIHVAFRFAEERKRLTAAEDYAVTKVEAYLALKGVTREAQLAGIERGKELRRIFEEQGFSDEFMREAGLSDSD